MTLKLYSIVAKKKRFKRKSQNVSMGNSTFWEVTVEKLVGSLFDPLFEPFWIGLKKNKPKNISKLKETNIFL